MRANYQRWIEGQANVLRGKCELGPFDRLDPFDLAERMQIEVIGPHAIAGVDPDALAQLLDGGARNWSGGALRLPDGRHWVILNPTHDERRQRPTLMEEIVHVHLNHAPTELRLTGEVVARSYKKSVEQQAYFIGAAALLPQRVIKGACTRGMTIEELAEEQFVSRPLVRFRINLLGIQLPTTMAIS